MNEARGAGNEAAAPLEKISRGFRPSVDRTSWYVSGNGSIAHLVKYRCNGILRSMSSFTPMI